MAMADSAPKKAAAIEASTTHRRRRRPVPSTVRSRMAATMLTRLIRMLVSVTVTKEIRKPRAKPLTRLVHVNLNVMSNELSPPERKMRAATSTTARPTPIPSTTPITEAARA